MSFSPRTPPPLDDWGRYACGRDRFGHLVWVRPRHMVERHETIEHLEPRHALSVLEHWIWDDFRLVEALHDRAHGPPADLDPDRRRAKMLEALESDVGAGRLVFHRERLEDGAPGTEPEVPTHPQRPPSTPWRPTSTWIEVELVERDGPVAGEPVLVVDPGGQRHVLQTGDDGMARVEGIEPGVCDVSFPRIDGREWARIGEAFAEGSDAVALVHLARADECMSRIAHTHRFRSPSTLYLHAANAELRQRRPNPDLLWPGDPVRILARDERVDLAGTGRRHRYDVKPAARWLRVVLHGFDRQPLVNEDYLLHVQGRGPIAGTTDPRGLLEEPIPAWVVQATIEVSGYRWELAVGALVPTANVPDDGLRGAKQRLSNLGYPARDTRHRASTDAASTDELDDAFDVEVWRFQRQESLASTGIADKAVIDRSVKRHLV